MSNLATVGPGANGREAPRAAYKRAWYERNRERVLAHQREYRQRNRDRIAAQRADRYSRERIQILAQQKERRMHADAAEVSARRRAAYRRNREKVLAAQRAAYAKDRTKYRASGAAYRERNRERLRLKQAAYNAAHRDEVNRKNREHARKLYATSPERRAYLRQWQAEHPELISLYRKSSWHKRRGAPGNGFTTAEWLALRAEYGERCAYCAETGELHADHRTPIARGGSNEISNILPACGRCNRRKHTKTEAEFRALLAAGVWPAQADSSDRGASHFRNASKLNGLPKKSLTSTAAGFVPPGARIKSR